MTTSFTRVPGLRFLTLVLITLFFTGKLTAQPDTLHLNYDNIKVTPHDTTVAKIDAWIKQLNGRHVEINVYAYYSRPDFKKFAQQRADELFLMLNRKARSLFTIVFIGPKRAENSLRSRVDIIYQKTQTPEEIAAAAAAVTKEKEEAAKKKAADKEAAAAEKAAKEKEKKDANKKESDSKKKDKSEVAAEQAEKKEKDAEKKKEKTVKKEKKEEVKKEEAESKKEKKKKKDNKESESAEKKEDKK